MHRSSTVTRRSVGRPPLFWLPVSVLAVVLLIALPVVAQDNPAVATATALAAMQESVAGETATATPEPPEEASRVALPFTWQGPASISARSLGETAPPLEAAVSQGDFQIVFVPTDDGPLLRILPDPATPPGGELQLVWRLDATSGDPPLNEGEVVSLRVTARVYAPDAVTQLFIADDTGSSSVSLDSLNWSDYQVARAIERSATEVRIGLRWANVPATSWLELRDVVVIFGDPETPLSPIDPIRIEIPVAAPTPEALPTMPPTPTPTPAAATSAALDAVQLPTATPYATPTPDLVIVTSTPTPVDVFEAATRVAQATDWARILGPATPTPTNMVTPTPTITPIVVTNTPVPGNAATATHVALRATAIAFTTGTPTPYPADAVVVVATDTPTAAPRATNTPRPTNTPTPIYVLLEHIPTRTPNPTPAFPVELRGKILFLSDYRGNRNQPDAMVMNPDGSGVGVMTSRVFYNRALAREAYSADQRYHVYTRRENIDGTGGRRQIFYDDAYYNSTGHQLTYFGAGTAWAATWSPVADRIALVSNVTGNDEIWIVNRGEWQPIQLTHNDWEWDHHPSFSPDGSQIVFSSNRVTGRRQLWLMDADGANQRQLTNFTFEAWNPVWVKYVDVPDTAPDVTELAQEPKDEDD